MAAELVAIITFGAGLASLHIATTLYLAGRISNQGKEIATLAERVSRLEGLIEGLFRPRPVIPPDTGPESTPRTGTDG